MRLQKLGCNLCFFFLYKHRQTWSVQVFNKTATVPAPPTELHRSTDLLHHIVFWKHRPQCNTAEALGGEKKKKKWRTILMMEHESKKTFEHLLFICPGTCASPRFSGVGKYANLTWKSHDGKKRHSGSHGVFNFDLKLRSRPGSYHCKDAPETRAGWPPKSNRQTTDICQVAETQTNRFVGSQSEGHLDSQCGLWHRTKARVRHEEGRKREIITASPDQNLWGENLFLIIQNFQFIIPPESENDQRSKDPTSCCAVRFRFSTLDSIGAACKAKTNEQKN